MSGGEGDDQSGRVAMLLFAWAVGARFGRPFMRSLAADAETRRRARRRGGQGEGERVTRGGRRRRRGVNWTRDASDTDTTVPNQVTRSIASPFKIQPAARPSPIEYDFISMIAMSFIMYKNQEPLASMSRYEYFSLSYSQFKDQVHHFLSSLLQSQVCNFTSFCTCENATSIDTTYLANTTPSALLTIFSPTFPSRVIIPQKFTISACMH